jgi:cytochrome P450
MDACITEALRLASGSMMMRQVIKTTKITLDSGKSYTIGRGDRVGIFPPMTHHVINCTSTLCIMYHTI